MGLDGIELLLAIEEEFQIVITDEEATNSETPDKLTEVVYSKLRRSNQDVCPSQHGFHKVRKTLIEQFNIPRKAIKLDTPLNDFFGKEHRKKYWVNLLSLLSDGQTVYAPLERPKWLKRTINLTIPLISFPIFLYFTHFTVVLSFLAACTLIFVLRTLTIPMKLEFPANFEKVKDLVPIIRSLETKVWDREDVYEKVKEIIVQQLGVKESEVLPDSHFVNDLGAG